MTLTQKILTAHARGQGRPYVRAGDVVAVRVDWTLSSELSWNGMERTYERLGRPALSRPDRVFLAVDHTVDPVTLATDERARELTRRARAFAAEAELSHFYDANQTILHTRFYRELLQPGQVVLGADSHTTSHGALGAFAIGLGGADVVAAMVLGESWIEVPEAIAVEYIGDAPFGVGGKDIILRTLGALGRNSVALERTVEYRGDAVSRFSTDVRFTIANMTAELGGLNGIFEADDVVAAWLARRSSHTDEARYYRADDDAPYVARLRLDLSALTPQIARPFSPDNVVPVSELAGAKLDGCFIGACTTTEEELVLAALILELATRDRPPRPPDPKLLVVPGDLAIQERLRARGLWAAYQRAGFRVGPPGCSMCLGIASERAGRGEVWLSSQNRNYPNRMGEGSLAHLASAATVAASAVDRVVTDPSPLLARIDRGRFALLLGHRSSGLTPSVTSAPEPTEPTDPLVRAVATDASRPVVPQGGAGSREPLRGRVQRFGDHVDTDAIIPGQFCHLVDAEALGERCFAFVRPEFSARCREGRTIVVAGAGWGSGSSREQAVWALRGAGVRLVIARSFAFIHKRNLVNEALPFLVLDDDSFFSAVSEDDALSVDLTLGVVTHVATGRSYQARPHGQVVSFLEAEGGLLPAIQRHGAAVFGALSAGSSET